MHGAPRDATDGDTMDMQASARVWSGVVAGGMAAGALTALVTPTKDESLQTKITAGLAGVGIIGGGLLLARSGHMQDGGIAAAVLGAVGLVGGIGAGGAAIGSWLVDRQN